LAEFVALLRAEFFPVRSQHPPGELSEIKNLKGGFPEFLLLVLLLRDIIISGIFQYPDTFIDALPQRFQRLFSE
jgi:hypothetical protein